MNRLLLGNGRFFQCMHKQKSFFIGQNISARLFSECRGVAETVQPVILHLESQSKIFTKCIYMFADPLLRRRQQWHPSADWQQEKQPSSIQSCAGIDPMITVSLSQNPYPAAGLRKLLRRSYSIAELMFCTYTGICLIQIFIRLQQHHITCK